MIIVMGLILVTSMVKANSNPESPTKGNETFLPKVAEAKVVPPNWWVGMKTSSIEVMIYDTRISDHKVSVNHPGIVVSKVTRVANPNYLFIMMDITKSAQPGRVPIRLVSENDIRSYPFELKPRDKSPNRIQGLDNTDFIYLIMPDRFANGNPGNDSHADLQEVGTNRNEMYDRHGGDLQGIIQNLDYLQQLGVTTLWLNPVLENDQPKYSYHGYAATDHYQIDKRFGTNAKYVDFVNRCHKKGMKVIKDIIHNHVGDQHWIIQDLPSQDWLNQHDEFTRTTYRATTLMDPYASEYDRNLMSNGWFDTHMPDLNQRNPQVARYLTQNNIWWIEYAGIDGFRIDTYAYPDQDFVAQWGKAILNEYPQFGLFAETWVHGPAVQAQFTQNNNLREGWNSNMPAVTDFQLYYAINDALNKPQSWEGGLMRIYYTLAQDFLYEDPYRNVVFLDNHDLSRFYSVIGEDFNKFKTGLTFLLTTRGIPCMYYGTEILMKNFSDPDGKVREDFPGGWKGDYKNKFRERDRSDQENEAFNFISRLANYRQTSEPLTTGKLMQFVPQDGVYVFFRYTDNESVMVIMNTSDKSVTLEKDRFKERLDGYSGALNIINDHYLGSLDQIFISPFSSKVLELQK